MKDKSESLFKGKKIVMLLGSQHAVPPVADANTPSWILYQISENLSHLDISVVSKWHNSLREIQYDSNRYMHVHETLKFKIASSLLRTIPYRIRKKKFGFSEPNRIVYYYTQAKLLKKIKPDVVITHLHYPLFKLAVQHYPKAKHIFYFHGSDLADWPVGILSELLSKADGIVTICQYAIDQLKLKHGDHNIPMRVITNGIDPNMFNPSKREALRQEARRNYGVTKGDIVLLYAGRLHPSKGLDKIFNVFSRLHKEYPEFKLFIAGDPNRERNPDHKFVENLKKDASELLNAVKFLGWIPYEKLIYLYAAVDICSIASLEVEGNSMFLLESMACGIPVVSTAVGGVPEIVIDNVTGILVSPLSIEQGLEKAFISLFSEEQRSFYGKQGAIRVSDNFQTKRVARDVESFVEEVIKSHK